jgi:hypothetical protein
MRAEESRVLLIRKKDSKEMTKMAMMDMSSFCEENMSEIMLVE